MKTIDSARTNFIVGSDRIFRLYIEHGLVKGVTPTMLCWWFCNIGGEMTYMGGNYPKYLVWHPKDHIHWSVTKQLANNAIGIGSSFRIVESFGRSMKFLVDSTELVEKLDETGIRLVKRIGGIQVFPLHHDFIPDGPNTRYKSTMTIGTSKKPMSTIFNLFIRPLFFSIEMGNAWLKHNVEEVGNFEFFLPEL